MAKRATSSGKKDENPAKKPTPTGSASPKGKGPGGSPNILTAILGALAVLVAAIIFAVTGVDLTGGNLSNQGVTVEVTRIVTQAPTQAPATPLPATAPPTVPSAASSAPTASAGLGGVSQLNVTNALGYSKDFWRVYFTSPLRTTNRSEWRGGIEAELAAAIGQVQRTLDIAAYEWESQLLTDAVLAAVERGVKVRMVVDNEHGLNDPNSTLTELEAAGVPIVDDNRSGFMHNKFMVMDGLIVWTGSMNYQPNDMFRNNNNVIMLRSVQAAQVYTGEFEEMFTQKRFGKTSPTTPTGNFNQSSTNIQIYYSGENEVLARIIDEVNKAQSQIRFAAFSFTDYDLAKAMMDRAAAGVGVSGVFETTGSETNASELRTLYCAGIPVFQDGNPGVLHHKFIVVDRETVITGSFNFSSNAVNSNDENLVIIRNADIAALYLQEWDRVRSIARAPSSITCS
jgi:phosphatidylserine/phosphatidylglycerophosphate/cardiolipin synthase-like enzyme